MVLGSPFLAQDPGIAVTRGGQAETIPVEEADPFLLELENMSGAISGLCEPLVDNRDVVAQAATLQALHESASHGRSVEVILSAPSTSGEGERV